MNRLSLQQLKWIAILAPGVVVGVFEQMRHTYFIESLHGFIGNFLAAVISLAIIFVFITFVFGILEKMQASLLRRNRELSIINTMVAEASKSQDVDQILALGLSAALEAVDLHQGVGWIWDERLGNLELRTTRGLPVKWSPGFVRIGQERPFLSCLSDGKGPQVMKMPPLEIVVDRQLRLVVLPLCAKDRLLGALAVIYDEREPVSLNDDLLVSISGHVSMAIHNAKLLQETLRRQQQAQTLYHLGMEISALLDLDKVLESVVEKSQELLDMDTVALALWDEHAQELVTRSSRGFRTDPVRQTRQRIWQDLNRRVFASGQPAQDTYRAEEEEVDSIVRVEGNVDHLAVPLKASNRIIGVLQGAHRHPHSYRQEDIELFSSLASQAAVAVENTGLYARVQNLAVLEERDRLAREMHDSLAQVLGFLSIKASAAQDLLAAKHLALARQELKHIEKAADEAYLDVREAILGLRTSMVPGGGILRALKEYLQKFSSQSGIKAELQFSPGKRPHLPPACEVQLIRIIQEALTNVRKHAVARRVWVRLKASDTLGQIEIEDDGQGFDLGGVLNEEGRYGLHTMKERAESVGGTLEIETAPGQGTKVIISLPLKRAGALVDRREDKNEPASDSTSRRSRPF